MRTTIRIDDELYREVKRRSASSGRTAAAVLEDAVRIGLRAADPGVRAPFVVRPAGAAGLRPGIDLGSNSALTEALDEELPLDALR